ncbi:Crp/Fnr family transcriptional regulator [Shewanella sp. GXUN23E]|uniref:Crp/Fnr family transcriptional regulator n=1 Tax=Shewanella sp. GXUN23E TaxID=3422498 RepID=UPI003D7C62B0
MLSAISLGIEEKKKSTLFFPGDVNDRVTDFFYANGRELQLKKGEQLNKNLLLNNFVYLESGLIFYSKRTNDFTRPKFLNVIFPGRLTDYHLLLDDGCTCCKSIMAARDSKVITIDKQLIKKLVTEDTDLFMQFMYDAAYYTERQTGLAIFLLTSSPEDKLIKFLFDILVVLNVPFNSRWLTIDLKLTRDEIADILHISTIKLDLMLGHFRKQDLLTRVDNKLCINIDIFLELSPCPLGREDARGCQSNNMQKFKPRNMIDMNCR